uniref:Uncharacterized protein n=1 Tax=Romanomermis culicivorax TaxID=13658 RepID=A0A915KES2_ROMCU
MVAECAISPPCAVPVTPSPEDSVIPADAPLTAPVTPAPVAPEKPPLTPDTPTMPKKRCISSHVVVKIPTMKMLSCLPLIDENFFADYIPGCPLTPPSSPSSSSQSSSSWLPFSLLPPLPRPKNPAPAPKPFNFSKLPPDLSFPLAQPKPLPSFPLPQPQPLPLPLPLPLPSPFRHFFFFGLHLPLPLPFSLPQAQPMPLPFSLDDSGSPSTHSTCVEDSGSGDSVAASADVCSLICVVPTSSTVVDCCSPEPEPLTISVSSLEPEPKCGPSLTNSVTSYSTVITFRCPLPRTYKRFYKPDDKFIPKIIIYQPEKNEKPNLTRFLSIFEIDSQRQQNARGDVIDSHTPKCKGSYHKL